jgi:protein phosphatase
MEITSAAQTDIGLVRSENEDRLLCADDLRLYAVADGIGGLPGGAEAAETAVSALLKEARSSAKAGRPLDLSNALKSANNAVLELGARLSPDCGLGTTMCATVVRDGHLLVANVGDSRCYLFRDGSLRLLTVDDTVENEVLQRRARGENVHLEERYRNALTRCIGQPMPLDVAVASHELRAGDHVLVCSDGITRLIDEPGIAAHFRPGRAPGLVLAAIVGEALARGGADNATGVLLRVDSL